MRVFANLVVQSECFRIQSRRIKIKPGIAGLLFENLNHIWSEINQ